MSGSQDKGALSGTKGEAKASAVEGKVSLSLALLVVAVLAWGLGVVQWMELSVASASGETFCSLSETFDCASVWAHPFAKRLHALTRVPVAGWGVIWASGAFATSAWAIKRRLESQDVDLPGMVARLFGVAGVGTSFGLFALSMQMGAYCPTCIVTYALVGTYAALAFKLPMSAPLDAQKPGAPLLWSLGLVLGGYLLVLYPALQTPPPKVGGLTAVAKAAEASQARAARETAAPGATNSAAVVAGSAKPKGARGSLPAPTTALGRFLDALEAPAQQAVARALAETRRAAVPTTSQFAVRALHHGAADARIKLVDFSDIRCGHCAKLALSLDELRRLVGEDTFSQESRWFPLDAECNPKLDPKMTDGSGVRCAGARAMICLEGNEGYEAARKKLFASQRDLADPDMVVRLSADAASVSQSTLRECMTSPQTESKLRQDIEYAWSFRLEGTPLVIVNGRKVAPVGPFLYATLLAEGDFDHPGWSRLPRPR